MGWRACIYSFRPQKGFLENWYESGCVLGTWAITELIVPYIMCPRTEHISFVTCVCFPPAFVFIFALPHSPPPKKTKHS